jgi:hypothetical protein
VDPGFKRELYSVLAARGSTLKEWFTAMGKALCEEERQPRLFRVAEDAPEFKGGNHD